MAARDNINESPDNLPVNPADQAGIAFANASNQLGPGSRSYRAVAATEDPTLEQLLASLGQPPPDVIETWRDQLNQQIKPLFLSATEFIGLLQDPSFRSEASIAPDGRLRIPDFDLAPVDSECSGVNPPNEIRVVAKQDVAPSSINADSEPIVNKRRKRKSKPRNKFIFGGAASLVAVIGTAAYVVSDRDAAEVASTDLQTASPDSRSGTPGLTPSDLSDSNTSDPLAMDLADSSDPFLPDIAADVPSASTTDLASTFSLDQFIGGAIPTANDSAASPSDVSGTLLDGILANDSMPAADSNSAADPTSRESSVMDAETAKADDTDFQSPENRQAVANGPDAEENWSSIELPSLIDFDATDGVDQANKTASVTLPWTMAQPLRLEFPIDVPLTLRADAAIQGMADQAVIARLVPAANPTSLQWTSEATGQSASKLLGHGRIVTGDGRSVFLRPSLSANPIPFDFTRRDSHPTWNLKTVLPPRVARVAVGFRLPEKIEHGWIESVDETSPRKAIGIAVFNESDDEDVALGCRMEIRCARKAAIRIRWAARLDREMAWTPIDAPTVENWRRQLTDTTVRLEKFSEQIAGIYSQADTDNRRTLRPQRDAIKDGLKQSILLQKRVLILQALMDRIAADGAIDFELSVQWPSDRQVILTTK